MAKKYSRPTPCVDLHTHSTASDGTLSPGDLVRLAAREALTALALTDHDTMEGVPEALAAGERLGVEVVPGVELSAVPPWEQSEVHVLGYWVDPVDPAMAALLERMRSARSSRLPRMLAKLSAEGMALDVERVRALAGDGVIGRPHVADAMVEAGFVADRRDAFDRFLATGKPGFVGRDLPSLDEALAVICGAGGLPVMAHPAFIALGYDQLSYTLGKLARQGLVGLECDYPSHRPNVANRFRRIARDRGLVPTAGSDFHGPDQGTDSRLGRATAGRPISPDVLEALRAARG